MDVDGLDLAALLAEGPDSGVGPSLLDDELFSEDLMQFLETIEGQPTSTQCHQKLAAQQQQQPVPAPAPAPAPAVPIPVATSSPAVAMSPTASTSSGCSSGVVAAPAPIPTPVAPAAAAVALAALQQAQMQQLQPACAAMLPRLVTTTAAQQMWTAMLQAACTVTPALAAAHAPAAASVDDAKARAQPAGTSRQGSREDSGDSSDTDQDDDMVDSKGKSVGNKRKAPEVSALSRKAVAFSFHKHGLTDSRSPHKPPLTHVIACFCLICRWTGGKSRTRRRGAGNGDWRRTVLPRRGPASARRPPGASLRR